MHYRDTNLLGLLGHNVGDGEATWALAIASVATGRHLAVGDGASQDIPWCGTLFGGVRPTAAMREQQSWQRSANTHCEVAVPVAAWQTKATPQTQASCWGSHGAAVCEQTTQHTYTQQGCVHIRVTTSQSAAPELGASRDSVQMRGIGRQCDLQRRTTISQCFQRTDTATHQPTHSPAC